MDRGPGSGRPSSAPAKGRPAKNAGDGRAKHVSPATIARKKEAERIARDNRTNAGKLKEIHAAKPSKFHAPCEGAGVNHSVKTKTAAGSKYYGRDDQTEMSTVWPRKLGEPMEQWPRKERQRLIDEGNRLMKKKNGETYAWHFRYSFNVTNKLGDPVDRREAWEKRRSIYDPRKPTKLGAQKTGVPKHMGVAICGGCGKKSYYGADGDTLTACTECREVYYCSDVCKNIDYDVHKLTCRVLSCKKTSTPMTVAGRRPTIDCWVVNRGMLEARKLLRRKDELWPGDPEAAEAAIRARMREVNEADAKKDAITREIQWMSDNNMDGGPRPCCS